MPTGGSRGDGVGEAGRLVEARGCKSRRNSGGQNNAVGEWPGDRGPTLPRGRVEERSGPSSASAGGAQSPRRKDLGDLRDLRVGLDPSWGFAGRKPVPTEAASQDTKRRGRRGERGLPNEEKWSRAEAPTEAERAGSSPSPPRRPFAQNNSISRREPALPSARRVKENSPVPPRDGGGRERRPKLLAAS